MSERRQWEINQRDLREPTPLTGSPSPEDRKKNNDTFIQWGLNTERLLMQRAGIAPDRNVSAEMLAVTSGPLLGMLKAAAARIADLEARILEVEVGGIRYSGSYQRSQSYRRGSVVTHGGSSRVCLKDAPEGAAPGEDHDHWQLMIKKGADGREMQKKGGKEVTRVTEWDEKGRIKAFEKTVE